MYPFLVSFFCLFLLLPVFKREEGLVVILNVFQSACVSMWNKSQKSVYITKATLQFTSVQFLMKLGRVFLWLLTSSSSFLSVNCRGAKKWQYKREEKSYFSLPLFFLSSLFAQRGRGKELRKKDTLLSRSRNEIRNQDSWFIIIIFLRARRNSVDQSNDTTIFLLVWCFSSDS